MRTTSSTRILLRSALIAGVIALSACGDKEVATGEPDATTTTAALPPPGTSLPTTGAPSSTATAPADPGDLPGEPIEFGPRAGNVVGVVAVAHDDVLNVRSVPGADAEIVSTFAPMVDDIVAVGNTRRLDDNSFWYRVQTGRGTGTGWVASSFVAFLGATSDVTAEVVGELGSTPRAETMEKLGGIVASSRGEAEPRPAVTRVTVPQVYAASGSVIFDVTGFGDDAQTGERLTIAATADTNGYVLASVRARALCSRGATTDGLCL